MTDTLDNIAKKALAEKVLGGVFDKNKFLLVCETHKRAYGSKRPPVFKCKMCMMVEFVGLMCNIPPDRREEVLEMLEYSTARLCEAASKGQIDIKGLLEHPKISIEKDGTL